MDRYQKPFFVYGVPRSGTTALANLLNGNRKISCIYHESNFLTHVRQIVSRKGFLDEDKKWCLAELENVLYHTMQRDTVQNESYVRFTEQNISQIITTAEEALGCLSQSTDKAFTQIANEFFKQFEARYPDKILGDKVHDYCYFTEQLTSSFLFPRIIRIKRGVKETVNSTYQFQKNRFHLFSSDDVMSITFGVVLREFEMDHFFKQFPQQQALTVTHELLKNDPEKLEKDTLQFLGCSASKESTSEQLTKLHAMVHHIKKYQDTLDEDQIAIIDSLWHAFMSNEKRDDSRYSQIAYGLKAVVECNDIELLGYLERLKAIDGVCCDRQNKSVEKCLLEYARALFLKGNLNRSRIVFEAIEKLDDSSLLFKMGQLYYQLNELDKAKRCFLDFEKKVDADSQYYSLLRAKNFHQLGRISCLEKDNISARDWFQLSLNAFPGFKLSQTLISLL